MHTLSKTNKLGVIILALQLLRKLNFPVPRLVKKAAAALGVSRKAGYEASERIARKLQEDGDPREASPSKEALLLRIRVRVLTYERDHPGVRFNRRRRHLPEEARSLCVRLLRDFRAELSESEIAKTIGVALPSLRRWDKKADSNCAFRAKSERRGRHRHASPEDEERVIELRKELKKSLTLEEFTELFNNKYPERKLDRKTITRILQRHGLLEIKPKTSYPSYHPPFDVYYPGAQVAIDGTECTVVFKSNPDEKIKVVKEVAIDIASCAILGDALGRQENSEGVEEVVVLATEQCKHILSLLSDNGSANRTGKVDEILQKSGAQDAVGQIFTFPSHPQTNGHMEGLFGQFSRIAGKIEIDDTSKETIAHSIVGLVWRVFIHFHNYSPRKRLDNLSPLEYLRDYSPLPEEVETARKKLRKQKERSEALRRKNPRLSDPQFRTLVEGILKTHGFQADLEKALKALLPFETEVIEDANRAFFVLTGRDTFDEGKRNFSYFMGIVRNKQKKIDGERLKDKLEAEQRIRDIQRMREEHRKEEEKKAREKEEIEKHPDAVILQYCRILLGGRLRWACGMFLERIHEAIEVLQKLGRATAGELERLRATIRSWPEYSEELKGRMIALLTAQYRKVVDGI